MNKMTAKLKIELRSDLCVGSGYSYAGVIDSDISYDDYGIPFIPARRLKGCMREAAEIVCPAEIETIFGKSGDNAVKGIVIGNARVEGYKEIVKELKGLSGQKEGAAAYLTPQNILELYTNIRAQTAIETSKGIAKENSLRFIRVVNQKNLCFYADIEYDSACQEQIKRIVKATRNLGMNRNRGLGSVRCTLSEETFVEDSQNKFVNTEKEGKVCITYILHNREPLLLSSDSNEASDSYISGKSILGRLAGEYLKHSGCDAESQEFRALFLDGTTIFTNANLTFEPEANREDATVWLSYYPAPLYLNKMKKSKVLVNQIRQDQAENKSLPDEYQSGKGNLPKKLKTQYVCETDLNTYHVTEAERELIFHNSRKVDEDKKDGLLYSSEALKEGQYFKGKIYTDWKYVPVLKMLLECPGLSFGKSKTAQYGTCELATEVKAEDVKSKHICVPAGEKMVVTLCSDAVFLNEHGYTVVYDEVKELIAHDLSISYKKEEDAGSMLQTKEITGYNTKWNLKRQAIPAVRAGSAFVYTIASGAKWEGNGDTFVGEKNLEGYGEVHIAEYSKMCYKAENFNTSKEQGIVKMDVCKPFLISIVTKKMLNELIYQYVSADENGHRLKMSASTVGRITLMLKESLNECRNDPEEAFQNFGMRIYCIKRTSEKEEAFGLLQKVLMKDGLPEKKYQIDIEKMLKTKEGTSLEKMNKVLKEYSGEEYKQHVVRLWGDYMNSILTYHKYLKKDENSRGKDGE